VIDRVGGLSGRGQGEAAEYGEECAVCFHGVIVWIDKMR
jgi:hypothetical protein